jgi:predicted anti-sigma-YlaC factor YlaD
MPNGLTCREIVELVTDYLEGGLSPKVRARVEQHLSGCDGCSNYLDQMRTTIRLTGTLREESLTTQQREDLTHLFRDWKKDVSR